MVLCQKGLTSWWKDHQKVVRIFFMNKNLSKSNKLWFPILPPYINDNCKKLTCNINLHLLFCVWMVPTFILGFGRHACLLQSSFHSLLKKHDICSLPWSIEVVWQGQWSYLCLTKIVTWHIATQNHRRQSVVTHHGETKPEARWCVCSVTVKELSKQKQFTAVYFNTILLLYDNGQ